MNTLPEGEAVLRDDTDFKLGDIVETIKGAKFWGEIIAFDNDGKSAGCTVLAVAPGFEGTKHVYPLKQLRRRALSSPLASTAGTEAEAEADTKRLDWMISYGARVSWSRDHEVCDVWVMGEYEEERVKSDPQLHYDGRSAIDAAIRALASPAVSSASQADTEETTRNPYGEGDPAEIDGV